MQTTRLFLAIALVIAMVTATAGSSERLQVGTFAPEELLTTAEVQPRINSVVWSEGDLRIRLTQAEPCGNYIPVDPLWEKAGNTIVLQYKWHRVSAGAAAPTQLCVQHVQAWVFRVPEASYTVLISDNVPIFEKVDGVVKERQR